MTILGYGAMELRGDPRGPAIDDEAAGALLNAVLDEGINLIDTSIDYGRSEELIGRHVGHRRDEYFLASKCGCLSAPRRLALLPPFRTTFPKRTSGPGSSRVFAGCGPIASTSSRCTFRPAARADGGRWHGRDTPLPPR